LWLFDLRTDVELQLPNTGLIAAIDEAIVSLAGTRWRKVAMIVLLVEKALEGRVPAADSRLTELQQADARHEFLELIAGRIRCSWTPESSKAPATSRTGVIAK
jgi:hypothetical protein